jgi:hypothetical protein
VSSESPAAAVDGRFALCLTHDVDRPFARPHQVLYHAVRDRRLGRLRALAPGRNPYWQFDAITDLEADLGVRSAFYFLSTPPLWTWPPEEWLRPRRILEHLGRYDPTEPPVREEVERLAAEGWEVGLHASLRAATDPERMATEYDRLAAVVEDVVGCRQHHLRVAGPETLRAQAAAGVEYDASLGSATDYGFAAGEGPRRPVGDGPVELPLTAMEAALPDPGEAFPAAWAACERLLRTARDREAVMTVLFHPRYFCAELFPGYRRLYRRLVERALEMDAWVGPPRDLLTAVDAVDGLP